MKRALLIASLILFGTQVHADAPRRGNPLWDIPLESLTQTQSRPLFAPDRRPPAPPPVAEPAPPPPPPAPAPPRAWALTLIGIVRGPDGAGTALFRDDSGQKVIRLKQGDIQDGWTLSEIHERDVIVVNEEGETTIAFPAPGLNGMDTPPPAPRRMPPRRLNQKPNLPQPNMPQPMMPQPPQGTRPPVPNVESN